MQLKDVLVVTALSALPLTAATVTIDETVRYQTIEGIGAFGAADAWWKNLSSYYDQAFVNLVVEDLGLSMTRNEYYPPEDGSCSFAEQVPYLQALKNKAESLGQEMKFISTYWTPPSWFKDNASLKNGGSVKPATYDSLARYCVQTVRRYKNEAGIDLYALSFANEPRFVEPYNSCVWTEAQYRDFIKVVGPKFVQENIATKLFGPEDMLDRFLPYAGFINADTAAKPYLGAIAVHGYVDGVNPSGSDFDQWRRAAQASSTMGIPLWMTETSGFHDTWESGLTQARIMLWAFSIGHISAWTWWQLGHYENNNDNTLVLNGTPTWLYYAHKHYSRYVRPGAVMVGAVSDASGVLCVAFHHAQKRTLTVVLINQGTSSAAVTLSGDDLPQTFTQYRSTPTQKCQSAGTVSPSSISLPGPSIVTLVADNYDGRTVATAGSASVIHPMVQRMSGRVFGLDGRLVPAVERVCGATPRVVVRHAAGAAERARLQIR